MVIRVVTGWTNYHGVSDNQRRVGQFLERTKRLLLRWLNRRGGKRRVTWAKRHRQVVEIRKGRSTSSLVFKQTEGMK